MRLVRGIAAAALLAGLALGGCSANPGAAAVVEGETITENELARAISDFAAVTGQEVEAVAMLGTLVVAPAIIDVGAEAGVAASDQQAIQLLDDQAEASGLPVPEGEYGEGVLQVARMTIVNQSLSSAPDAAAAMEEIGTRIAEADIEVSPRYGEFENGQIAAEPLPWIESTTPPPAQPVQ